MKGFAKYIMTAVKGACMGAADVIPGVSGGTIAFIMGIYDDFVSSLASINSEAVRLLLKGKFKAFWKHINGSFLLSLVIGIGISVISLAGLMQALLTDFPIQTWAFFFGLIVASSIFIIRGISGWKFREGFLLALGVILGTVICTLSPTQTPDRQLHLHHHLPLRYQPEGCHHPGHRGRGRYRRVSGSVFEQPPVGNGRLLRMGSDGPGAGHRVYLYPHPPQAGPRRIRF